jgi:NitT/TauT family transport system ATP-binding protein
VSQAKLEVLDVAKRFVQPRTGRPTQALDGVDLSVAPGEFVAVVGPSGCGKTTLLLIVAGLLRPGRGQVLVDGQAVTEPARDRAMVFQDPALLPWRTALGNVAYGLECLGVARREAGERARDWLAQVGLDGFGEHYPHELSGGMRQRVNLARALAVGPDVLLLDEPFASLDALTRERLQADLLAIWDRTGSTVLFVTHDIDEAVRLADRVAVLTPRPGRVRAAVPVDLSRPRGVEVRHTPPFRVAEAAVRALLDAPHQGKGAAP